LSKKSIIANTNMAYLHQYNYVFAIGLIFAFLDAFMIGGIQPLD
jgi:hypothetical protein